jgi:glycosyltransferase involved in cell wall biosynthesis
VEAIASVQAQAGVVCNLVVVDDGSPCPADICAAVANVPHATVLRQPAAGVSAARNRGLAQGRAQFIAFLDDDDVWDPLKSIKQLTAMQERPDAVASACDGRYIDASGDVLEGWRWAPVDDHTTLEYFAGTALLPRIVTTVFRRDACEGVGGFNEQLRFAEDHELMFEVLLRGVCVPVRETLMSYRQHDGNVTLQPGATIDARSDTDLALTSVMATCVSRGRDAEAALLARNRRVIHDGWCLDSLREIAATWRRQPATCAREVRWLMRHCAWLIPAVPAITRHLRGDEGHRTPASRG